ncbi:HlyD family efflux transporter periplasmic adaptor subunit [Solilutibacter silvestris]|uniref:HlyD family efflux transporter periplasmic adaptor subunit n=1 Tax=Solilutibacter silvestris TaxID=1645665 RepID=UPI003D352E56
MSQGLFRKEVLEAKRASWLGSISLVQPLSLWVLTGFAAAAALAIVLFLVLGSCARRERVTGQLVPSRGLATVLAPATGVVSVVDIPEGANVQSGQRLAVVTIPSATAASGNTAQALEAGVQEKEQGLFAAQTAQDAVLNTQAAGLSAQLASAQREWTHMQDEIATQRRQVAVANDSLDRLKRAEQDKLVSILQVKQQEGAVLAQASQLQALQRQAIEAQRNIEQLQQQLRSIPGQRMTAQANYRRDHAALEQERVETAARGALQVNAPVSGLVATQLAKPGQAVQVGQPLMSVLPNDSALEAELLVPSHAIGFIEPGDQVLLRYQAFPYQKFGHYEGKVTRISRSALSPNEMNALGMKSDSSETVYRVMVQLAKQTVMAYGKPEALKPGMVLEADVLGEKRSLIEWIFEPLYSLKGRV